jgi:class 3 adenylate cyclase
VRAGLSLIGAVEQLGPRLGLEAGELQLRVGVNSGEVVHAMTGADAGRVTGDTEALAAAIPAPWWVARARRARGASDLAAAFEQ